MKLWAASLILLLASCSSGEWAPHSVSLASTRECNAEGQVERQYLVLSFALGQSDSYSFTLTDPSGLVWEGVLEESGGFWTSGELALGIDAVFRNGEYSWTLANGRGEVESGKVDFAQQDLSQVLPAEGSVRDSHGNTVIVSGRPSP